MPVVSVRHDAYKLEQGCTYKGADGTDGEKRARVHEDDKARVSLSVAEADPVEHQGGREADYAGINEGGEKFDAGLRHVRMLNDNQECGDKDSNCGHDPDLA